MLSFQFNCRVEWSFIQEIKFHTSIDHNMCSRVRQGRGVVRSFVFGVLLLFFVQYNILSVDPVCVCICVTSVVSTHAHDSAPRGARPSVGTVLTSKFGYLLIIIDQIRFVNQITSFKMSHEISRDVMLASTKWKREFRKHNNTLRSHKRHGFSN